MDDYIYAWLFFIFFSFIGWLWEVAVVLVTTKKLVNRGFLIGPFCPIYGVAAACLYITLMPYFDNIFILFIMGIIFTSALEYITSWLMEKMFNTRWWDYSRYKFNINGRISLHVSIFWGFAGVIIIKYVMPLFIDFIGELFNERLARTYILIFSVYFITDLSISLYNAFGLDKMLEELANIRTDIKRSFENSKIFEAVDGVKMKADELNKKLEAITSDFIKGKTPENFTEKIADMRHKLNDLKNKYNEKIKSGSFLKTRLLNAFPKLIALRAKKEKDSFK